MCDICNHVPCLKRCPNYYDAPVTVCPNCGAELFELDIYYPELDVCEYCLDDFKQTVQQEYYEYDDENEP